MNLIHGDCLVELKNLPDKSINFFYLDLPYGQTACRWDKKIDLDLLWIQLKRLAKNERTPFFFSCTTKFGYELIKSNEKYFRWDLVWEKNRASGFLNAYKLPMRKHELIYCFAKKCPEYDVSSHSEVDIKPHSRNKPKAEIYGDCNRVKTDKIHKERLPTSILPPQEDHELIYCFAKKCPEYDVSSHNEIDEIVYKTKQPGIDMYASERSAIKTTHKKRLPTSVIRENSIYQKHENEPDRYIKQAKRKGNLPTSVMPDQDIPSSWIKCEVDGKTNHRTSKPISLMEFLLKYWTKEDDVICDVTMGAGSMGVACKNMNRKFIGIELNEDIFNIAFERINSN